MACRSFNLWFLFMSRVEQQLMSRMISEMYRPPLPDPAQNDSTNQSELEEQSVTSDIGEQAGSCVLNLSSHHLVFRIRSLRTVSPPVCGSELCLLLEERQVKLSPDFRSAELLQDMTCLHSSVSDVSFLLLNSTSLKSCSGLVDWVQWRAVVCAGWRFEGGAVSLSEQQGPTETH